jgi:hypothetical protein
MPKLDLNRVALDKRAITQPKAQAHNYLKFSTWLDIQGVFEGKKEENSMWGHFIFWNNFDFCKEKILLDNLSSKYPRIFFPVLLYVPFKKSQF